MNLRRLRFAPLLLALLFAGGAAHSWHHVLDPHCESGAAGDSHPCLSCAALHGATVAGIGATAAPPATAERGLIAAFAHAAPCSIARGIALSRAPPIA